MLLRLVVMRMRMMMIILLLVIQCYRNLFRRSGFPVNIISMRMMLLCLGEKGRNIFFLSHSGKPIFSRYGDEHKLEGFSATLQAIISFVENGGDRVKSVRAGKHQVRNVLNAHIFHFCFSCERTDLFSLH